METFPLELAGAWKCSLASDLKEGGFFLITDDGRSVSFVKDTREGREHQWLPIRAWCEIGPEGMFCFRGLRNGGDLIRRYFFAGRELVFESVGEVPMKRWICVRLEPEEVPEWFQEESARQLAREWPHKPATVVRDA